MKNKKQSHRKSNRNVRTARNVRNNDVIVKKFRGENPFGKGTTTAKLLDIAVKSGTVQKFRTKAEKLADSTPTSYLGMFRRGGFISLKQAA